MIYRFAERGAGVLAGVIMEIAFDPDCPRAAALLLAEVERRVDRGGGELMLHLAGLSPQTDAVFRELGYRRSPEIYDMLVWPKRAVEDEPALADLANWRFAFRDHDAF